MDPPQQTGSVASPAATVPQSVLDEALKRVRQVVRGNGAAPDTVTVKQFDGGMVDFETFQIFRLTPSVSEKQVNGRLQGQVLQSEAELRRELPRFVDEAMRDPQLPLAVKEFLRGRPDLGFGLDRYILPLPALSRQHVVYIQCPSCTGSAVQPCTGCRGTGHVPCGKCLSRREITCPACQGSKTQQQGGNRVPCARCQGLGRVGCPHCRQTGQVACTRCRGSGKTPCPTCGATGWRTLISSLSFSAEGNFQYDRQALPGGLAVLIDRHKALLVTSGHATVTITTQAPPTAAQAMAAPVNEIAIPYRVQVPYGDITFSLRGMEVTGRLFGKNATLAGLPPFLEKTAGRGIRLLGEAAQSNGNVARPLSEAVKTRLVADAVTAAASHAPGTALSLLRRRYPLGIRDATLTHIIKQADGCLRTLTRLPRLYGLGLGMILCAALDEGYFVGLFGQTGRAALGLKGGAYAAWAGDALLPLIGGALCVLFIRILCGHAISQVLDRTGKDMAQDKRRLMPKPGRNRLYAYGGSFIIYAAMLQLAVLAGHAPPWVTTLRHLAGLR